MALSRVKNWVSEVLYAADLNAEFNNVLTYLNSSSVVLTQLGIGMAPSNIVDVLQTTDITSTIQIHNNNAGVSSAAQFLTKNNLNTFGRLTLWGGGYTTSGVARADGLLVSTNGGGGTTIATTAAQPIYFHTNSVACGQFAATGAFSAKGTATNDSAAAGYIGEVLSGSASSVSLVTATSKTLTSVSLTAGDWDVSGLGSFTAAAGTTVNALIMSISATNNTLDSTQGSRSDAAMGGMILATYGNQSLVLGPMRISLASTTTYYLVANAAFGVSTLTGDGLIRARRVR